MEYRTDIITYAAIIAITLGIIASIFFIVIDRESYSALYIIPNSTIVDLKDNSVFFGYGVRSYETERTDYVLTIFSADTQVNKKNFSLNRGQILEEQVKIILPQNSKLPNKISLKLNTGKSIEEVHFWIK
jgi:hypothetical protein